MLILDRRERESITITIGDKKLLIYVKRTSNRLVLLGFVSDKEFKVSRNDTPERLTPWVDKLAVTNPTVELIARPIEITE